MQQNINKISQQKLFQAADAQLSRAQGPEQKGLKSSDSKPRASKPLEQKIHDIFHSPEQQQQQPEAQRDAKAGCEERVREQEQAQNY